jgi:hypothetical protein
VLDLGVDLPGEPANELNSKLTLRYFVQVRAIACDCKDKPITSPLKGHVKLRGGLS